MRCRRSVRWGLLVGCVTWLVLGLAACRRHRPSDANIVVIAIDTLRADHVGAYGYRRPTTPRLDEFAARSVVFETAIAQSSWTLPSFASVFTGLLPSHHRAGEGRFPAMSKLDDASATLAEILAAEGWATASFVSNVWVGADVGMARGFQRHVYTPKTADAAQNAIAWLQEGPPEPFFLFVHLMDPHQPYTPSPEDRALFVDPGYAGPADKFFMGNGKVSATWTLADRLHLAALYDAEIRSSDRLAGRVFDALAERGLDDRTIVVVLSDHGEELSDHDGLGHGHTLYDEMLHVPLVIRFPGGPARRVAQQVRTMDVFATVLDAIGRPVPVNVQAVSLMPLVRGEPGPAACDLALAEYVCFGPDVDMKAARTPTWKLLLAATTGKSRLFDIASDPHEKRDLVAMKPQVVSELSRQIQQSLVATLDGYHLIAVSGGRDSVVRARFGAVSAFREVALSQPERADAFRLSEDRRTLDVKLRLAPATRPLPAADVDGIRIRTVDDRIVLLERLEIDGVAAPEGSTDVGNGRPFRPGGFPWRFLPHPPNVVRYPLAPPQAVDRNPRLRLSYVKRGPAPVAEIRPETREQLRALGYLP
jgi:arylsulfatase A-like enzyme